MPSKKNCAIRIPEAVMKSRRKSFGNKAEDYAGGDFAQRAKDFASLQSGMNDNDMGRYGAVRERRNPLTVDQDFKHVSGGGAPGSYHGKKTPRSWRPAYRAGR